MTTDTTEMKPAGQSDAERGDKVVDASSAAADQVLQRSRNRSRVATLAALVLTVAGHPRLALVTAGAAVVEKVRGAVRASNLRKGSVEAGSQKPAAPVLKVKS